MRQAKPRRWSGGIDEEAWVQLVMLSSDQTGQRQANKQMAIAILAAAVGILIGFIILLLIVRSMGSTSSVSLPPIVPGC